MGSSVEISDCGVGQAEWSVDCVVGKDDHENGEYTQYEIGTEILSLYLSEAQEPSNEH